MSAALGLAVPDVIPLGAVAGVTTRLDLPTKARSVRLQARGGVIRWSYVGTDGAPIGDAMTIPTDETRSISAPGLPPGSRGRGGAWSLYVAPRDADSPSAEALALL